MKWAAAEIEKFDNDTIDQVQAGPYILNKSAVSKGDDPIIITAEDVEIITDEIPGYEIAGKANLTVALDITITEVLKNEGNAREFVNRIQNVRKDKNFDLTDRIMVSVESDEILRPSLIQFKDYICREILADTLEFVPQTSKGILIEVNDASLTVNVTKTSK
jgi:isoleucyl-tRNA synthetase